FSVRRISGPDLGGLGGRRIPERVRAGWADCRDRSLDRRSLHSLLPLCLRHAVAGPIDRRLIVLGARGFFGSVATDRLLSEGFTPVERRGVQGTSTFRLMPMTRTPSDPGCTRATSWAMLP